MTKAHTIALAGLSGLLLCASVWAGSAYPAPGIHMQVLAASCAACHGTNGNSVGGTPVLAGLHPEYFISRMQAFRSGEHASTVMYRHARGLTEEEIVQLADHFSRQVRRSAQMPQPAINRK